MNVIDKNIELEKFKNLTFIVLGMGCFWGAEKKFWSVRGVSASVVGYSGGNTSNPSYEEVCSGQSGHVEVVKVFYDKKLTDLNSLLKVFWESHDPTQLNRQGNDIGTQYKSVIFASNKQEKKIAENSKLKYQEILRSKGFNSIRTEISIIKNFYFAEDYHQKYLLKNPNGYCGLGGLNIEY